MFSQGVSSLCSAKRSVACSVKGQWLVLSQEVSGLFSQGVSGLCSPKGSVACVQSGSGVGACMWMFDGWELYVYGEFHVKCEIMFDECALQMKQKAPAEELV